MKRTFLLIMTLLALAAVSAEEQKCFGEKPHPDTVGDIVFADGTAMAWREGLSFTDEQKAATIAVISYSRSGMFQRRARADAWRGISPL